jgi:hypothetical protein
MTLPCHLHVNRVGVSADSVTRLEDGDVVLPLKEPSGHETAHASTDDGDPHGHSPGLMFRNMN